MHRSLSLWGLLSLAVLTANSGCSGESVISGSYLVQFDTSDASQATGTEPFELFSSQMAKLKVPFTFARNYTTVVKGAHIKLDDKYSAMAQKLSIVLNMSPNQVLNQSTTIHASTIPGLTLEPKENVYLKDNYIVATQIEKNLYGRGVKIGFVDSGLDYRHPMFGGCFKTCSGARVVAGYDFVGDQFTGYNTPKPDKDPLDKCNGHGTHVTGIAAGNVGVFQGAAPQAQIGAYRAIGCGGSTTVDLLMAAMEMAYTDGMNIINVSLGVSAGSPNSLLSRMATQMTSKGVIVVAAAGDEGQYSLFTVNSPGVGTGAVAVGSFDQPSFYSKSINVDSTPGKNFPRSYTQSPELAFNFSKQTLVLATDAQNAWVGCRPITANVNGKIALAQNGVCSIETKAANAQAAGAVALIVYDVTWKVIDIPAFKSKGLIPTVMVEYSAGTFLLSALQSGQQVIISSDDNMTARKQTEKVGVSDFSSWGPGPDLSLKPNLIAPGRYIYSALPLEMGSYGIATGTAMSSAFVTGAFALLREFNPKLTSEQYVMMLLPKQDLQPSRYTNLHCSPVQQGYGALQMQNVFNSPDFFFSYNSSLGDNQNVDNGKNFNFEIQFKVDSYAKYLTSWGWLTSEDVTMFTPSGTLIAPRLRVNGTFTPKNIEPLPTWTTPNSNFTHRMTLTLNDMAPRQWIYGGYITFNFLSGTRSIRFTFPFLAMDDNFSQIPIVPPSTTTYYPQLIDSVSLSAIPASTQTTYQLSKKKYPAFQYFLQFTTDLLLIYVVRVDQTSQPRYLVDQGQQSFLAHSFIPGSDFRNFVWSGNMVKTASNGGADSLTAAPNGSYQFRVQWKRPLADYASRKDSDFIIWQSPTFKLSR